MAETFRTVEAYKDYFADFLLKQTQAVKDKILDYRPDRNNTTSL